MIINYKESSHITNQSQFHGSPEQINKSLEIMAHDT